MRKYLVFSLLLISIFSVANPVHAQLNVKTQLGYGTNHSSILGEKINQIPEWSTLVGGSYAYEDLLFTGMYHGAHGLKEGRLGRSTAQLSADYLAVNEEALRVYGGLGYQLLGIRIQHPDIEDNENLKFSGSGFVGQAVVKIDIAEHFKAQATITGTPWFKWSYTQDGYTTTNIDKGRSFNYQVDLVYDFNPEYGIQLGLMGGSYGIPKFEFKENLVEQTSASFTGINAGVVWRF